VPTSLGELWEDWIWGVCLHGFCVSGVRPVLLLLLVAIVGFGFGSGLGKLPILFWRPRRPTPPRPGDPTGGSGESTRAHPLKQSLIGLALGALVWQVFLSGYVYEEFATNDTVDRPPLCEVRKLSPDEWSAPDPRVPEFYEYTNEKGEVARYQFRERFRHDPQAWGSMWLYVLAAGSGLVVLVALAAVGYGVWRGITVGVWRLRGWRPAPVGHEDRASARRDPPPYSVWLPLGLVGGMMLASGVTMIWVRGAPEFSRDYGMRMLRHAGWGRESERRERVKERIDPGRPAADAEARERAWYLPYAPVYAAFILNFYTVYAVLLVVFLLPLRWRVFSPAVGIILLCSILIYAQVRLKYFFGWPAQYAAFLLFALTLLFGRPYKLRFPALRTYYRKPASLHEHYTQRATAEAAEVAAAVETEKAVTEAERAVAVAEAVQADAAGETKAAEEAAEKTKTAAEEAEKARASTNRPDEAKNLSPEEAERAQADAGRANATLTAAQERVRAARGALAAAQERVQTVRGTLARVKERTKPATSPAAGLIDSNDIPYPFGAADGEKKPPVAIVCVSGGGSRAAAWAVKVLNELERYFLDPQSLSWKQAEIKEPEGLRPVPFPHRIRLMTGASGGMIGAAAFVASLNQPGVNRSVPLGEILDGLCEDFLTPIVHTLVFRDMPSLLSPVHLLGTDRGGALEDAWGTALRGLLNKKFAALRPDEQAGWRPSLIFSPMLVEDGRQLFISNLELSKVVRNAAVLLGENLPPNPDNPVNPVGRRLLSREGLELFKVLPGADRDLPLSTAARMSASFPYILPAVTLPTDPPRRVVDAGYYDNYGVGIAASWLFSHSEWIRKHTSGVVLIQIRDGVSGTTRRRELVPDSPPGILSAGLQWLTSPPSALWHFRQAAHTFRNDNLIHQLDAYFRSLPPDTFRAAPTDPTERERFQREFFTTVTFELQQGDDVALNFALTEGERNTIIRDAETPGFRHQVASLLKWWSSR
jgi:hypothetical protein